MAMQIILVNGLAINAKNFLTEFVVQYLWDLKVALSLQEKMNLKNSFSKINKKSIKLIKLSVLSRAPSPEYKKIKISILLYCKNF